jgi:hypothetical protein
MSTGDQSDMLARLTAVIPPWFPDDSPITTGALSGIAAALAFGYSFIQFAKAQTRIATASGGWLDLIAWDFFGARFTRRQGESDASFQPRILSELLRPRQTRAAIVQVLVDLTGKTPVIFEPWNPGDCGAYGVGTSGYGCAGCYGSLALNNQIFVTAVRSTAEGIPNVGGYSQGPIGYGVAGEYVDQSQVTGAVTDADIYAAVAETIAAGVTAWVDIVSALPSPPETSSDTLDSDAITFDNNTVTMDHF